MRIPISFAWILSQQNRRFSTTIPEDICRSLGIYARMSSVRTLRGIPGRSPKGGLHSDITEGMLSILRYKKKDDIGDLGSFIVHNGFFGGCLYKLFRIGISGSVRGGKCYFECRCAGCKCGIEEKLNTNTFSEDLLSEGLVEGYEIVNPMWQPGGLKGLVFES